MYLFSFIMCLCSITFVQFSFSIFLLLIYSVTSYNSSWEAFSVRKITLIINWLSKKINIPVYWMSSFFLWNSLFLSLHNIIITNHMHYIPANFQLFLHSNTFVSILYAFLFILLFSISISLSSAINNFLHFIKHRYPNVSTIVQILNAKYFSFVWIL